MYEERDVLETRKIDERDMEIFVPYLVDNSEKTIVILGDCLLYTSDAADE